LDILGIGLPEVVIIFTLLLIFLGPDEIVSAGKTTGKLINKLVNSEQWESAKRVNRQVKNLPNQLAREANIADFEKDIEGAMESLPRFPEVPIASKISSDEESSEEIPTSAKTTTGNV
jgi:Sec-independent protein translocase protein TatA